MWGKPADTMSLWHIRGAQLHVEVSDLGKPDVTQADDVFFRDHLEKYDMYPVYLNGNHSFTHIVNDAVGDGTLLLLKDSFGNTLATELAAAYHEIWMVDLRYCRTQAISEWIADKGVDAVLINYGLDSLVHDTNILFLELYNRDKQKTGERRWLFVGFDVVGCVYACAAILRMGFTCIRTIAATTEMIVSGIMYTPL